MGVVGEEDEHEEAEEPLMLSLSMAEAEQAESNQPKLVWRRLTSEGVGRSQETKKS